jgi:hypothetical protein
MYLCLNHTVSEILMLFVFFVYITWHL